MSTHQQKVILVTGSSSGIGKTIAEHLHKKKYRVFRTQRQSHQSATGVSTLNFDTPHALKISITGYC